MTKRLSFNARGLVAAGSILAVLSYIGFAPSAQRLTSARSAASYDAGQGTKISPDLMSRKDHSNPGDLIDVIISLSGKPTGQLNAFLNRNGVHINATYDSFDNIAIRLPAGLIDDLAKFPEVQIISADSVGRSAILQHTNSAASFTPTVR